MERFILRPLRLVAVFLTALVHNAVAQGTEVRFVSRACRVAFSYPAEWEVTPDTLDRDATCRFSARPRDWRHRLAANDRLDVYTISLQVAARGVWTEVAGSVFQRRDSGWVVRGRHDLEQPADSVHGSGWTGLRGMATQGCYRTDGVYAGLCDQPTALVGTADRNVLIIGGPRSEDTFDRILATLRFR